MKYAEKQYGQGQYGVWKENEDQPELEIDLMRYLPPYWQENVTMKRLQRSLGMEVAGLSENLSDLVNQLFVETATWGLSRWEEVFGIGTDLEKSDAFRRERVKAKIRGAGTTTKQMIVNVASAFANGEATVLEYPRENRFVVKFVGVKGVPGNMKDLSATIEEIKPAHLAFTFAYTYNYWQNLRERTWNACRGYTWDQVRVI